MGYLCLDILLISKFPLLWCRTFAVCCNLNILHACTAFLQTHLSKTTFKPIIFFYIIEKHYLQLLCSLDSWNVWLKVVPERIINGANAEVTRWDLCVFKEIFCFLLCLCAVWLQTWSKCTWMSVYCWVNVAGNPVTVWRCLQDHPEVSLTGFFFFFLMKCFMHWSSLTRICRGQPDLEGAVDALNLCQSGEQQMTALSSSVQSDTHTQTQSFLSWNGRYFQHDGQAVVSQADFTCMSSQDVIFLCVIYVATQTNSRKWVWISCICERGAGWKEWKLLHFWMNQHFYNIVTVPTEVFSPLPDLQVACSVGLFVCAAAGQRRGRGNYSPLF